MAAQATGKRFLLAESPVFFEAQRHVLQALQAMDADALPLQPQLLRAAPSVEVGAAANASPGAAKAASAAGANDDAIDLDDAQQAACTHVLTRQLALLHGPPATGKSTVLQRALAELLESRSHGAAGGAAGGAASGAVGGAAGAPLLLVCGCNRALDTALVGLLDAVGGAADGAADGKQGGKQAGKQGGAEAGSSGGAVVRVGARSESARLQPLDLCVLSEAEGGADAAHTKAWKARTASQAELRRQIEALVTDDLSQREPTAEDVEEVCTTAQIMSLCAAPDGWAHIEEALGLWLEPVRVAADERAAEVLLAEADKASGAKGGAGGGAALVTPSELARREAARLAAAAPVKERLVRSSGNRAADWAAVTRVEYEDKGAADEELWEEELRVARSGDRYLHTELERAVEERLVGLFDDACGPPLPLCRPDDIAWPDEVTQEMLLEHDELWSLDAVQREQLAWLWLHKKFAALYERLAGLCEQYERACRQKRQLAQHVDLTVLRKAKLVGMTTTALARHASLVAALGCEVVVIDDAAEVRERRCAT